MKRLRKACKGCKCAAEMENGEYECMAKDGKIKSPPQVCKYRIDAEAYLDEVNDAYAAHMDIYG